MTIIEKSPASAPVAAEKPGWNIVADLTPPELIEARRVTVVRFLVLVAIALVMVCCGGAYFFVRGQADLAGQDLGSEQAITSSLLQTQRSFSGITALQNSIASVDKQIATLMAPDVDVPKLLTALQSALPTGMTLNQIDVEIASGGTPSTGSRSGGASGPGSLDASGATHIGTITLGGTGTKLADLPVYIDRLSKVNGIFDPFPLTNQATAAGTSFTVQLTLTDALLTQRSATTTGGK
jgi:hypothetical protein